MTILQASNIEKIKSDSSLCKEQEKLFYYKFNIIPRQKLNGTTFFIVEDVSQDINNWVKAYYGDDYLLIKANSEQILNLLNSHFGVSEFAGNYLYYKNPNFSAKSVKLNSIFFSSFFVIISILTLTEKYAYFALMLIFIVGCSSSLFKFVTKIFGLRKISNQKVDYDKMDEPIYTIFCLLLERVR